MARYRVAVAAPHPAAVDAARAAVERGGGAVDAAIAAAASIAVVYPHLNSAGGDVFALVRRPGRPDACVNASGAYGSGAAAAALADHDEMPVYGPLSVSVPGAVSGWGALHGLGAVLDLPVLLEPAIAQAADGVPVAPGLAASLRGGRARLIGDPGMAALFYPDGEPLAQGAPLRQPALARTLRAIAAEGPRAVYEGSVAALLAPALERLGVPVTAADLAAHRPEVTGSLAFEGTGPLAGLRVATAPPNSQGFLLLQVLSVVQTALADAADLSGLDAGLLAEAFWSASRDRDLLLADPRVAPVPVDRLLSSEHVRALARAAAERAAGTPRDPEVAAPPRPNGDTIAIATMGDDGTAVSLIQSNFHGFGSGLLEPGTGLELQNRAASFSLDPRSPNAVAPGKRPGHTLMPVLVDLPDGSVAAHGTMGGKAQPQIHTQLLLRALAGADAAGIVGSPRWIVGGLSAHAPDDVVFAEASVPTSDLDRLRRLSMPFELRPDRDNLVGHAVVARRHADGRLEAAADPRADGTGEVV